MIYIDNKGPFEMMIDTRTIVSMSDANQNFSKVCRIVDEYGRAVIFKNNAPRYLVLELTTGKDKDFNALENDVLASSAKNMDLYDEDFRKLAK